MSQLITEFDIWRQGYGNVLVDVFIAGTTDRADLFLDEPMTIPADNPQTLLSMTLAGETYGKFDGHIYTDSDYYLEVNGVETGVQRRPLTTLTGEVATLAIATAAGSSRARAIEDFLSDIIFAEDFGVLDPAAGAATNNATLQAAIDAAAALGGGEVWVPEGALEFTGLSIPQNVLVRGRGREVTSLLCQTGDKVITLSGDRAGLAFLTLDGVNNQSGSIGIYQKAVNETRLTDVRIANFQTGWQAKGSRNGNWQDVFVDACATGAQHYGDVDAGGGNDGDEFRHNKWSGGAVTVCTTVGIDLEYVDKKCYHNTYANIGFEGNTGIAFKNRGARYTEMPGCWWTTNTHDWDIADGSDPTHSDENTVIGLHVGPGGEITGGTLDLAGVCQDIVLEGLELGPSTTLNIDTIDNNILAVNCIESDSFTIAGTDSAKFVRITRGFGDSPGSFGVTTDATPVIGWSISLEPGEVVQLEANVVAVQRNGAGYASYHIGQSARRPGSTLAYETQTANFTVGLIVTGGTSGAKARILADSDSGTSGTLTLKDITKEFISGELLTDTGGGSAVADGTLNAQNAALLGSIGALQTTIESDAAWACVFAADVDKVNVMVTGASATSIEWSVNVKATVG